jgi:hypothetical protein
MSEPEQTRKHELGFRQRFVKVDGAKFQDLFAAEG